MSEKEKSPSVPNIVALEEEKDLHKKEMDHKEGNTKGPTGNPIHPKAHEYHADRKS